MTNHFTSKEVGKYFNRQIFSTTTAYNMNDFYAHFYLHVLSYIYF